MVFASRTSCTPFALSMALDVPYDEICRDIHQQGGQYQKASTAIIHRILHSKATVKKWHQFKSRWPKLSNWKKFKRGTWVVILVHKIPYCGVQCHCAVLDHGKVKDNGWIGSEGSPLRVCTAWQIE